MEASVWLSELLKFGCLPLEGEICAKRRDEVGLLVGPLCTEIVKLLAQFSGNQGPKSKIGDLAHREHGETFRLRGQTSRSVRPIFQSIRVTSSVRDTLKYQGAVALIHFGGTLAARFARCVPPIN